jgi:hypothetical protein
VVFQPATILGSDVEHNGEAASATRGPVPSIIVDASLPTKRVFLDTVTRAFLAVGAAVQPLLTPVFRMLRATYPKYH